MYVMCGITGAINSSNSVQIVFEGLKTLEYRGYDSWGIAYKTNTEIETIKQVGKISSAKLREINSIIAIGHTRWATHGKVCLENTHPVLSQNKKISVVHNGIIENFQELKKFLEEKGFDFATETDTETISNLIEFFCREKKFEEAVAETSKILEGRYAFAAIHAEQNLIIGVKNGSPLVLGRNGKEFFIASDANAFPAEVKEAILLEDGELAV
ncbi:MAG: class II glutamine amidotransferase, partial [Candidatus Diapherotrites archaeon]|nr:class II glutamine amidotransferase [Candidatus Diapherotrites archaeon]